MKKFLTILITIFSISVVCFAKNEIAPMQVDTTNSVKTDKKKSISQVSHSASDKQKRLTALKSPKLNGSVAEHTVEEREKNEPFFHFYKNSKLEAVTFEGTIQAISAIPDPAKNNYDDCLYILFVKIDSVFSKGELSKKMPSEAVIAVPIMKNKIINKSNIFRLNDKVSCVCSEYEAMQQSIREIQLSDDIQSFEHKQYYAFTIKKINAFTPGGNKNFARREITILPILKLPQDKTSVKLRKARIQNEIRAINEEIKRHGGSFASWRKEYKNIAEKYSQLKKEKWKGWINDCYFDTEGNETTYNPRQFINDILPYKKYLEKNNIDLIIVRIPSKSDFAARVLAAKDFQENPEWIENYLECLKNDIEIVDPMPEMYKHKFDYPLFYYFYPQEFHPCEGTALIAAKTLSHILERYKIPKEKEAISLAKITYKSKSPIYYWPKGNKKFNPEHNLTFLHAIQHGKNLKDMVANSGHPILFLSNSFFWHPQRFIGASVPAYTAYYLQTIPDWYYRTGSGNGLFRDLLANSEYLNSRKAVVMVGPPWLWTQKQPPLPAYLMEEDKMVLTLEKTLADFESEIKITPNDSFVFSINSEKELVIRSTPKQRLLSFNSHFFSFEIKLPSIPDKKMCMVRFNFTKTSYLTFRINDKNSKEKFDADSYTLPPETKVGDFFIPVKSSSRDIIIKMWPSKERDEFILKNIELWYY